MKNVIGIKIVFWRLTLIYSLLLLAFCSSENAFSQAIDTTKYRVRTDWTVPFPYLGSVNGKSIKEIISSNWLIGCETLDRDYANYDAYKDYLDPLGIKRIRLQGGWDKTEKVKGVYDWTWLDHIINDAVARGLQPWVQTSYGNHNYVDGGGANLGAGVPRSAEALLAWDKWVHALVTRYKDKVKDWEIWNEPNFGDNLENTPEKAAALNIRTIDIIKKIQPEAKVSGLAMGHISIPYADSFFKFLASKGKLNLFDNMTYHDYSYNPDANYGKVEMLSQTLKRYSTKVKLRQGENGAPSEPNLGGALGDYNWSELSQAKWNTRRMLGDLGHDIESSVFTIIEIAYTGGPITKLNVKGLIKSDSTKRAIRPKVAYYAVQNVVSIFDQSLKRIESLHSTFNTKDSPLNNEVRYSVGTDRSVSVYGYENKKSKQQLFTLWIDDFIPKNTNDKKNINFVIFNGQINEPVYVDLITGNVYKIPNSNWNKKGDKLTITNMPIYDAPIVIADKSLINYR
ncbi:GH39 family glycosyl hydrolase [Pedobacter psychroterrae]|uniref:Glycosyl hydrolases family 39 N-terminal catalytic domain-containing protein n=1 Tax=Pedobacter psychroterrae TaxID=2530453 RepID=A0A4R0NLM9_9SPHI|nr:hypothetical protein [Pedobacter psychroterrae]TCD01546.1 hypothetical protein EZ437_12500 [Pedobacter psychroterrae]